MVSIVTSDMLKGGASLFNARGIYESGKAGRDAGNFTASRLLDNAKSRLARGSREAREIGRQGRVMESDAAAALGGQGAAGDPVLLAKIRAKSNSNALSALFDAREESYDIRQQAIDTKYSAQMSYANSFTNSFAAGLTGIMTAGNSFGDWMKTKGASNQFGASNYRTVR